MDIKEITREEASDKKLTWVRNTHKELTQSHIQKLKEKYPTVEFYLVDGVFCSIYADNIYSLYEEIETYKTYLKTLPKMASKYLKNYNNEMNEIKKSKKNTLTSLKKIKNKLNKKLKESKNVI